MKCNKTDTCNSTSCSHKKPHAHLEKWCGPGSCKWSPDTQCVPEDTREELELVLIDEGIELTDGRIDRIMKVFEKEEEIPI